MLFRIRELVDKHFGAEALGGGAGRAGTGAGAGAAGSDADAAGPDAGTSRPNFPQTPLPDDTAP